MVAMRDIPVTQVSRTPITKGVRGARVKLVTVQGTEREVEIIQEKYPMPAIAVEKLLDIDGHKVGYIVLRHFVGMGARDFSGAALNFQRQGIDELVLDLRMNGGGLLDTAQGIARMIGGKRLEGRTFLKIIHNNRYRDLDSVERFNHQWTSLSLPRLFIITSEKTCSASEALIQGLSPYMEVITVGAKTCGKPVGFLPVAYGDRVYYAITFKSVDARGEGDYYD